MEPGVFITTTIFDPNNTYLRIFNINDELKKIKKTKYPLILSDTIESMKLQITKNIIKHITNNKPTHIKKLQTVTLSKKEVERQVSKLFNNDVKGMAQSVYL